MKLLTIFDIFAALQLSSLSYYSPPNASIFNYERFEKLNEKISGREKVAISIMPHELLKYALECTILFHFSFFFFSSAHIWILQERCHNGDYELI